MARIAIQMPTLGYDTETGRIAAWLREVGATIVRGEPIADVETEKTTIILEALDEGTLVEIVAQVDDEVRVGEPIGWLDDGS